MFEETTSYIYKQWKIMSRRPGELAWIFVYPFIGLLSIGIYAFFLITQGAPLDSILYVLVGVISWNFYDVSQRAITFGITLDIWSNCLRHSFAGNSRIRHFILGNSVFGLISSVLTFFLVAAAGLLVFGFNLFSAWLWLIPNLLIVFIFATGIGLMIDSLLISQSEKYMSLIWTMTGVIMIFSGVYYPASVLPAPMQAVSQILPTTHAINSMGILFRSRTIA